MAIQRNPNNPKLAVNRTQPPTPNETRSAINTANQCAIEVDELWKVVKELKFQISKLEEAAQPVATPTKKRKPTKESSEETLVLKDSDEV